MPDSVLIFIIVLAGTLAIWGLVQWGSKKPKPPENNYIRDPEAWQKNVESRWDD